MMGSVKRGSVGVGSNQYRSQSASSRTRSGSNKRAVMRTVTRSVHTEAESEVAARWQSALPWLEPTEAAAWDRWGFTPSLASQFIEAGVREPEHARGWYDAGFSPGETMGWRAQGSRWASGQGDPSADPWVDAAAWRSAGFAAGEAGYLAGHGHTPASAVRAGFPTRRP